MTLSDLIPQKRYQQQNSLQTKATKKHTFSDTAFKDFNKTAGCKQKNKKLITGT